MPTQTPLEIVQGYIKKLLIEVPITRILYEPVIITIEDMHIILKSSEKYDRSFVKRVLLGQKHAIVDELIKNMKESTQEPRPQQSEGYFDGIMKLIWENLRVKLTNIHIRFEDTNVSRCDQAFNFGFMAESIIYSMTNNRFQRTFLDINDKIQEKRSFALLTVTKFAMYWNSNAQDNWTKNKEFINLTAQKTLDFSKRHTDNLMRKHHN